ncbi:heterokaryon incompatibility protein-domain-containing protein [Aspergillus ambiguus]|uniref:heterokaryon incompatibility protein-domain-containing protein n=1 Tax=Aspergillus ambiguus TaxID=176160 RepID=UPI003CCCAE76
MRLIQTFSIQQIEFLPDDIPRYAILSHTWAEGEVLLSDIEKGTAQDKAGWEKVSRACKQASSNGYEYIWIDTCCIDKSSSAELSEAINSMYVWYQNAAICYTYLSDVLNCDQLDNISGPSSDFSKSRWFTRGFTLQELLAPKEIIFFSRGWVEIGRKSTHCTALSSITGIGERFLKKTSPLEAASVAQRMSWAAERSTRRPEDMAYCLMGIFSVNMAMLYGEGKERAFIRLQEEIMKQTDDQSIFAWTDPGCPPNSLHGLLATSPKQFAGCGNIICYRNFMPRQPFLMTNRGLRIELSLTELGSDICLASLYCPVPPVYRVSSYLGIYLKRLSSWDDRYARINAHTLKEVCQSGKMETVYVPQGRAELEEQRLIPHYIYHIRQFPSPYDLVNIASATLVRNISSVNMPGGVRSTQSPTGQSGHPVVFCEPNEAANNIATMPCFDVAEVTEVGSFRTARHLESSSFEDLSRRFLKRFNPKAFGTTISFKQQWVTVTGKPQAESEFGKDRYYIIDIAAAPCYPAMKGKEGRFKTRLPFGKS